MSGIDFDREIAQIYRDMELYLIKSMQRNLARHLAEEADAGLRYPQWQAEKLKELKRCQRENRQIISSRTRGLSDRVSEHMKAELRQGSKHELKRYKKALGKGYKSAKAMRKSFFKVNDRKISGMINALQNDLGAANTAVLRMMNDTYRQTIFRAGMYASNGVMTETQAYDMAVKDFLERGINCIEYRDGRRVNIADYASMAVRTANQRAYMVGEGEFRKSIGETLVIISHHTTACKLCKPFERKVLIDDVYSGGKPGDGDYMLLSEAMKLGLFHPRCRHGLGTYYPELEDINHYNNEENDVSDYGRYNRAHIENMVQRYKRLTIGSVDPENVARYQAKLREWSARLDNSTEDGIINLYFGRKGRGIPLSPDRDIPETVAAQVEEATTKITDDFKDLERYLEPISFGNIGEALGEHRFSPSTGTNKITLNKKAFSNPVVLKKSLNDDFLSGLSYQTDKIESLVAHEMGHNAHVVLALKRSGLEYGKPLTPIETAIFDEKYREITQEVYMAAFSDESFETIRDICEKELGSIAKSPRELIAQSFGNYYFGAQKQRVAIKIVKYFKRELIG